MEKLDNWVCGDGNANIYEYRTGKSMNITHCQSCGLPFDKNHECFIATENDGSKSDYCTFCYKDGEFIQADATIGDMIEVGVPHLGRKIGEEAAREQLSAFLPTLRRWKK